MAEDEFRLTVPPPVDDCYTSNGYLKKKCRYDKELADLYKVYDSTSSMFSGSVAK